MSQPATTSFDDFDRHIRTDVAKALQTVLQASENRLLTSAQLSDLQAGLKDTYPSVFLSTSASGPVADPGYGADFDLAEEINSQIKVVRALRAKILGEDGSLNEGINAREAKELIASGTTMVSTLMKHHKDIVNQDRLMAVEAATIEAVKTLPPENQEAFFETLERGLARGK